MCTLAKRYAVSVSGYPVSHQVKKDCVAVTTSAVFSGKDNDIKAFCRALKKDKRTLELDVRGNFGIIYMEQHIANRFFYQAGVIYTKPAIVTEKGEYIFELAAWDKSRLMKVINSTKMFKSRLHWIKQKRISSVHVINISPNLTEKQRQCLELAIKNDYYTCPRSIDLKTLAKLAKVSYSTFQFHLRNAEKKLIPFMGKYLGICR